MDSWLHLFTSWVVGLFWEIRVAFGVSERIFECPLKKNQLKLNVEEMN
jgi:hypothetical protein